MEHNAPKVPVEKVDYSKLRAPPNMWNQEFMLRVLAFLASKDLIRVQMVHRNWYGTRVPTVMYTKLKW